jgi:dGTPase
VALADSPLDIERYIDEPAKRGGRTEFARDRARIIHSWALRRLGAKTQVVSPDSNDFPRTRLTHSLECAQVGRELGAILGTDPDLMEAACLAHDLGHPPFGHNGEEALAEISKDIGGFEGNAQSFRLLTRIEAKSVDAAGKSVGLNLTRAVLDGATKYPWPKDARIKFGVYDDDLPIFNWVRANSPKEKVSLEAQVMDWSDDIAYSVHDLEDAIVTKMFTFDHIGNDLKDIHQSMSDGYLKNITFDQAASAWNRLSQLPFWLKSYGGSYRDLAALKDLSSQLIGRFALGAQKATQESFAGPLSRYQADLVIPEELRIEVALLKSLTGFYIINHHKQQDKYQKQQTMLMEIVSWIAENPNERIDPFFRESWGWAKDDAGRYRVIIDQVASLTDYGAISLYENQMGKTWN